MLNRLKKAQSSKENHLSQKLETCIRRVSVQAYLDGDLTSHQRVEFQKHLRDCFDCQQAIITTQKVDELLVKQMPDDKLSGNEKDYFLHEVFEGLEPLIKKLNQNRRSENIGLIQRRMANIFKSIVAIAFSRPMVIFYIGIAISYLY